MTEQLRSELRKMRTTRTIPVFLLLAVALALLGVIAPGLSDKVSELAQENNQRTLFGSAATNAVFMVTFAGLIAFTTEFRYGTIRPTLLFEPRRRVVLGAKLVAAALLGVVFALACVAVSFAAGLVLLRARDVDFALTSTHTLTIVCGTIAASAICGMLGVTVGALIRNQVGAILALAAYSVAVDVLLFTTVPSLGRLLPAQASNALAGLPTEHLLTPAVGGAVLLAWALVFVAAATVRTDRSDI
jgi:ABC-type transport system involved in multi-copper enzyme maturation permease subunit